MTKRIKIDDLFSKVLAANPIIVEDTDEGLATFIGSSQTCCTNFTHSDMLNHPSDYPYANTAGSFGCAHPFYVEASQKTGTVIQCAFSVNQRSCMFYKPDFSILRKVTADSNTYYLTSYRTFDGSYIYKIYDSNRNVYFDLSYEKLSKKQNDIDTEANKVFENFLSTVASSYEEITLTSTESSSVVTPEKKSYLSLIAG